MPEMQKTERQIQQSIKTVRTNIKEEQIRMNKGTDREKTKEYYDKFSPDNLCGCADCRNFYANIKAAYPAFSDYLSGLGADIEKPHECWTAGDLEDGTVIYPEAQYVIIGDGRDFKETETEGIEIKPAVSYPQADTEMPYFVIEAGPFYLKRTVT